MSGSGPVQGPGISRIIGSGQGPSSPLSTPLPANLQGLGSNAVPSGREPLFPAKDQGVGGMTVSGGFPPPGQLTAGEGTSQQAGSLPLPSDVAVAPSLAHAAQPQAMRANPTAAKEAVKARMVDKSAGEVSTIAPTGDARTTVISQLRKAIVPDAEAGKLKLGMGYRVLFFFFGRFISAKWQASKVDASIARSAAERIFTGNVGVSATELNPHPKLKIGGFDLGNDLLNLLAHVSADEVQSLLADEIKKAIPKEPKKCQEEVARNLAEIAYQDLTQKVWGDKVNGAVDTAIAEIGRITTDLTAYSTELAEPGRMALSEARLGQIQFALEVWTPDTTRLLDESTGMPGILTTLKGQVAGELQRREGVRMAVTAALTPLEGNQELGSNIQRTSQADLQGHQPTLQGLLDRVNALPDDSRGDLPDRIGAVQTRIAQELARRSEVNRQSEADLRASDEKITRSNLESARPQDIYRLNQDELVKVRRNLEALPQDARNSQLSVLLKVVETKTGIAVQLGNLHKVIKNMNMPATRQGELLQNQRSLEQIGAQITELRERAERSGSRINVAELEAMQKELVGKITSELQRRDLEAREAVMREEHTVPQELAAMETRLTETAVKAMSAIQRQEESQSLAGMRDRIERLPVREFVVEGDQTSREAMIARVKVLQDRISALSPQR